MHDWGSPAPCLWLMWKEFESVEPGGRRVESSGGRGAGRRRGLTAILATGSIDSKNEGGVGPAARNRRAPFFHCLGRLHDGWRWELLPMGRVSSHDTLSGEGGLAANHDPPSPGASTTPRCHQLVTGSCGTGRRVGMNAQAQTMITLGPFPVDGSMHGGCRVDTYSPISRIELSLVRNQGKGTFHPRRVGHASAKQRERDPS